MFFGVDTYVSRNTGQRQDGEEQNDVRTHCLFKTGLYGKEYHQVSSSRLSELNCCHLHVHKLYVIAK